ncbi:MAG: hypothetical protein IKZ51_02135 [Bacteroidales bacterium]|nr:hypothetical protein [Bacteroidales bacterium]
MSIFRKILVFCFLTLPLAVYAADRAPVKWQEIWQAMGVNPVIAESVVWPEYMMYSYWQDWLETSAVSSTYVTSGSGFDFSIGVFQMKPSFVEKLEHAWMQSGLAQVPELQFDISDNRSAREARLSRMQCADWQAVYLALFLRLLYISYGSFDSTGAKIQEGIDTLPVSEQVRLAAAAYNSGCLWPSAGLGDLESLRSKASWTGFPRSLLPSPSARKYCYASLAREHYLEVSE